MYLRKRSCNRQMEQPVADLPPQNETQLEHQHLECHSHLPPLLQASMSPESSQPVRICTLEHNFACIGQIHSLPQKFL